MSNAVSHPDEQIVQRVLAGHRQEFGELVGRYLPMVHAFAYAHVDNHADAEDASQEAFLRAFQSLDKLRDRSRFGAWLVGIARHTCSGVRNSRRRQARLAEETRHAPSSVVPDMAQRDLRELVRRKIAELDESSREVLLLYYFSGKKIHEVADLLEISPDAAAKRIQRAREALGEKLLRELYPTVQPERSEEDRKAAIMGLVMGMPVDWESPATEPDGQPTGAAAQSLAPTAGAASPGTIGALVARYWSTAFLVLAFVLLGIVVTGVWFALEREPAPPPPATQQEYVPSPKASPKAAAPSKGKGAPSLNGRTKGSSKGKLK